MPPAVGRTKVCTVSLTVSRAGILSATISTASNTATTAITQPFSSQVQPDGRVMRLVNFESSPISSIGM